MNRLSFTFASVASALIAQTLLATDVVAQRQLGGAGKSVVASPVFESWSFGDGITQPSASGGTTLLATRAAQWSVPLMATIPLGQANRWTIDLAAAYASGEIVLKDATTTGESSLRLSGLTDTKVRLTGHLVGDRVILTLGANAPSGKTKLTDNELEALRFLAAPALQFQIPVLGSGPGATAGLVFAKKFGEWAWALGSSYEVRSSYAPVAVAAGISAVDFNPGDITHLSIGGDGFIGANGLSIGFSADFFSNDLVSASADASNALSTQLGPIGTIDARLRFATTRFNELSLFVVDRFRTAYKQGGVSVEGSSGNYLDVGLTASYPLSARSAFNWELSARHHTGLKSDSSIATAAAALGGARAGISYELGSGAAIQPFARAQFGNIKSGNASVSTTGFLGGLTISKSF